MVALTVAGLATGAMWYVQPHTPQEVTEQRRQQQESDLSDSHEQVTDERRRQGMEDGEAKRRDQLRSSELRPRPDLPRLRFR
ncbi:hypothetical protein Cfla_3511 [Cellulomonas flavigena DSM 20109]|uniref:Uncharacterized protein n=1 Tax=Cellulomonas flavigena (strain ATCC 482 / DSM 20109 / BCRC 11376 / JCM 18109 / NBRC 3775 / NCIMB 8073 / NRS 134) TaxID=446466 RepID=D5UDC7_CELFN|nr:hypothetical protein [Cellulomonas flavigena]ADG76383.1 hypothetical protein Cfla_3511 [Cellulomonas flavigena DSM 20109]